jgi:hypothetical protein
MTPNQTYAPWKRANDTKDSSISTAEDHGEYYYNKLFN